MPGTVSCCERGTTGLSVAFDLPTQLGLDSDDERAWGEVGRVGVPISTVDDMRRLFDDIDQGAVTTSMTINAPAALLLLMYEIVAEERGVDPASLGGTIQNDILKEYAARGTYIFPPRPSMRLVTDTFAYCAERLPAWNTISVSGYHMREAGSSAAQEIAFTVANGLAYIEAALAAGLSIDQVAPRMSFFFSAHSDLFEEVAKFRAARRLWARLIRERYAAAGSAIGDGALPYPDRRRHADRAAAAEQRRARGLPGAVRGARWHPEPAHELVR